VEIRIECEQREKRRTNRKERINRERREEIAAL
jgi:hypothetical protein